MRATRSGSLYQPRVGHRPGWFKGQNYNSYKSHVTDHLRWTQAQQLLTQQQQQQFSPILEQDFLLTMMSRNQAQSNIEESQGRWGQVTNYSGQQPSNLESNKKIQYKGFQRSRPVFMMSQPGPSQALHASATTLQAGPNIKMQAETQSSPIVAQSTSSGAYSTPQDNYKVQNSKKPFDQKELQRNYFDEQLDIHEKMRKARNDEQLGIHDKMRKARSSVLYLGIVNTAYAVQQGVKRSREWAFVLQKQLFDEKVQCNSTSMKDSNSAEDVASDASTNTEEAFVGTPATLN